MAANSGEDCQRTDGGAEARSPSGEVLGVDRVPRALEQTLHLPLAAQANALIAEVARHTGHGQPLNDDATVIAGETTESDSGAVWGLP